MVQFGADPAGPVGAALAGDDEHQPQPGGMGVQDEADQFGMRLGHGHAVQVDAAFKGDLAELELAQLAFLHAIAAP